MVKFKTHNDGIAFESSCLQGYIDAGYDELVKLFGEPMVGDGYKVDAEWNIKLDDETGTYATIYNYKDGINYCGEDEGIPKREIRDWHIGGESKASVEAVTNLINNAR